MDPAERAKAWPPFVPNQFDLGSEDWLKKMWAQIEKKPRSTDHPRTQRAAGRPKMHTIVSAVAKAAGQRAESIRMTRGHFYEILFAWLGWHEGWVTLRSIASLRLRSERTHL